MGKFHFFTDYNLLLNQAPNKAFGPAGTQNIGGTIKEAFRLTSLHTATAIAKAYAVCDGIICVQVDNNNPSLVNIILKPTEQPSLNFVPIQYYIYKGIDINSLVNTVTMKISDTSSMKLAIKLREAQQSWNTSFDKTNNNPPGTTVTKAPQEMLGIQYKASALAPNQVLDTDAIDGLFFRENVDFQLPVVEAGWSLGEFGAEFGLDIIFESEAYSPKVGLARTHENFLLVTALPGMPAFKHWHEKEECLNFMDVAAFYGSMFSKTLKATDSLGNVSKKKDDNIYQDLLLTFNNRNKTYIDIRNEKNFSLNYFENYDDNILIAYDSNSALNSLDYYNLGWPIMILENNVFPAGNTTEKQSIRLSLPCGAADENPLPAAYLFLGTTSKRYPKQLKRKQKFLDIENNSTSTSELSVSVPNIKNPGDTTVASLVRVSYVKQYVDTINTASSNTVIREENFIDNKIRLNFNPFPWSSSSASVSRVIQESGFCDKSQSGNMSFMADIGYAKDASNGSRTFFFVKKTALNKGNKLGRLLSYIGKEFNAMESFVSNFANGVKGFVAGDKTYEFTGQGGGIRAIQVLESKEIIDFNKYSPEDITFVNINGTDYAIIEGVLASTTAVPFNGISADFDLNLPVYLSFKNEQKKTDDNGLECNEYEIGLEGYDSASSQVKLISTGLSAILSVTDITTGMLTTCNSTIFNPSSTRTTEAKLLTILGTAVGEYNGLRGNILNRFVTTNASTGWTFIDSITNPVPFSMRASIASLVALYVVRGELQDSGTSLLTSIENKFYEVLNPVRPMVITDAEFRTRLNQIVPHIFDPNLDDAPPAGADHNRDYTVGKRRNGAGTSVEEQLYKLFVTSYYSPALTVANDGANINGLNMKLNIDSAVKMDTVLDWVKQCLEESYVLIQNRVEVQYKKILNCFISNGTSSTILLTSLTSPPGTSFGQILNNTNAISGLPVGPVFWDGSKWVSGTSLETNLILLATGDGGGTRGLFPLSDNGISPNVNTPINQQLGSNMFLYQFNAPDSASAGFPNASVLEAMVVKYLASKNINLISSDYTTINLNIVGIDWANVTGTPIPDIKKNLIVVSTGSIAYCFIANQIGGNYDIAPHLYLRLDANDPFNTDPIVAALMSTKSSFNFRTTGTGTSRVVTWTNGATFIYNSYDFNIPDPYVLGSFVDAEIILRSASDIANPSAKEEILAPILALPGPTPPDIDITATARDAYKSNKFDNYYTDFKKFLKFSSTSLVGLTQEECLDSMIKFMLLYNITPALQIFGNGVGIFSNPLNYESEVIRSGYEQESQESNYGGESPNLKKFLNLRLSRVGINFTRAGVLRTLNLDIQSFTDQAHAKLTEAIEAKFPVNSMSPEKTKRLFEFNLLRVRKSVTTYDSANPETTIIDKGDIYYSENIVLSALRAFNILENITNLIKKRTEDNVTEFDEPDLTNITGKMNTLFDNAVVYIGHYEGNPNSVSDYRILTKTIYENLKSYV